MLRACCCHLQSIKPSPPILVTTLKFSSSLSFSSPSKNFSSSFLLKPVYTSLVNRYASATMATSSSKASFSSGNTTGGQDREILVQHLLVKEDNLNLLVQLLKQTAQGTDLSDLAAEHSICPSKEQGGMLGWVRKGQMVPEFEEVAFNAPLNKVVRCKTKFGWHLLQVLSEREAASLQDIEPQELHAKMQDPSFLEDVQLIDVREPEEIAQSSLPGFVVLPLRQFGSWSSDVTTKFNPEKETYVLCHHGVRSLQVAKWLQTQFQLVFATGDREQREPESSNNKTGHRDRAIHWQFGSSLGSGHSEFRVYYAGIGPEVRDSRNSSMWQGGFMHIL